jgi:predicted ATP-grasp superfamily ATP-dependent carboligase
MFTVLVACFDNWNTLSEVPSILKKGGFEVDIFCGEKSWLKHNKFYSKWIPAEEDPAGYIKQLQDLVNNGNYSWVLLGDEKLIKLLNETLQDESMFYKIMPLSKIENRELLSSKNGLSNVCAKYDIRSPGYIQYNTDENDTSVVSNLQFPVIVKLDFSWGGKGIEVCNNHEELKKALTGLPKGEQVIIQEYINGIEVPVEALFWKGRLLAFACSEILDYDKDKFTYSTRRRYFPADELLKTEVESFGQHAGIHGFVNMAYIKSSDNNLYYLIEADTRPSSWSAYTKYAGVSFSKALQFITSGSKTPPHFTPKTIEIALFHKDIRRGFYKRDIKGLMRWVYKVHQWRFIPFYDSKLLAYTVQLIWEEFFLHYLKKIGRKAVS